jgi:glycosyltransferase involved in cell wall biosynthesis
MTRVVVARGHFASPWDLRPWELLPERFDVEFLATERGDFDTSRTTLSARPARALRDALPGGRAGDLLTRLPGDRYLKPREAFAGADVVHAAELGFWFSMQAAKAKEELGFKLVLTVWETLPFRRTFRNVRTRAYRERTLAAADLFLAATERAAACLRLEGADPARIRLAAPGIDLDRFAPGPPPPGPVVLSPGRLVWEKGHYDVLRAVAALRSGVVDGPRDVRALIVGRGPEEARLRDYAADLGIAGAVELRPFVPYHEMPGLYGEASCMVLGSLPTMHWEEQFGMVLAEAMAAGLPIVASTSGAIPEVAGPNASYVAPGDWLGLAHALAAGPLAGRRVRYEPERLARFSAPAAAERYAAVYDELLG